MSPSVEPVKVPDAAPTPMAVGSAPPSESQVAATSAVASDPDVVERAVSNDGSAGAGGVATAADLDNGAVAKVSMGKVSYNLPLPARRFSSYLRPPCHSMTVLFF